MSIIHHKFADRRREPRSDKFTVWLLIVVVVAAVLALTFGDAEGWGSILRR